MIARIAAVVLLAVIVLVVLVLAVSGGGGRVAPRSRPVVTAPGGSRPAATPSSASEVTGGVQTGAGRRPAGGSPS